MINEFEKHFLSLEFATGAYGRLILDSCTFDPEQDGYLPDVKWMSSNDADDCIIYCCMLNTAYLSFKKQQSKVDELQEKIDKALKRADHACIGTSMFHKQFNDVISILRGED